jgi:hypothetical protein
MGSTPVASLSAVSVVRKIGVFSQRYKAFSGQTVSSAFLICMGLDGERYAYSKSDS